MDWDKLKTFHAVAETGSLTAAADRIGLSQSAASRQMTALEEQLGVHLFHRHARGLALTEAGSILYRTTTEVSGRIARIRDVLTDTHATPRGVIHLTVPVALGVYWLTPRLARFASMYPDIELHIDTDDHLRALEAGELHVAIQFGAPEQVDLIARPLFDVSQGLYASRSYLVSRGIPQTADDLDQHALVSYGARDTSPLHGADWPLRIPRADGSLRRARMTISNMLGVLHAIQAGAGIGSLPSYMADEHEDLQRVLPDASGPQLTAHFVYLQEARGSKRVLALWNFLQEEARNFYREG